MERSVANSDKGSKADSSKDSASRIKPVGENKGKELDPLRGLVQGAESRGCGPSLESVAQRMTALPGAQRREAALSLQRTRGNRFMQGMAAGMSHPAAIQRQAKPELEEDEDEVLQGKFESHVPSAVPEQPEPQPNRTGMPDRLKAGIESLSGIDMSDVRVHANSDKPARLNALAYTQGNQIYLGPGQERHLPHEAWHAVQQKQGRVLAMRLIDGQGVNDDSRLEMEADRMGGKVFHKDTLAAPKNGRDIKPKTLRRNRGTTELVATPLRAPSLKQIEKLIGRLAYASRTIQLVSKNAEWKKESEKYRSDNRKERIPGDAEWIAIERFCIDVPEKFKLEHTVKEVIAEAEVHKHISFKEWKGNANEGTLREGQHLMPASVGKKLGWPNKLINSAHNAKMLLAGRVNKGIHFSKAYIDSKIKRGYKVFPSERGLLHIVNGIAHPNYNIFAEKVAKDHYKKAGKKSGDKIPIRLMKTILKDLRSRTKKYDTAFSREGVDDMTLY